MRRALGKPEPGRVSISVHPISNLIIKWSPMQAISDFLCCCFRPSQSSYTPLPDSAPSSTQLDVFSRTPSTTAGQDFGSSAKNLSSMGGTYPTAVAPSLALITGSTTAKKGAEPKDQSMGDRSGTSVGYSGTGADSSCCDCNTFVCCCCCSDCSCSNFDCGGCDCNC